MLRDAFDALAREDAGRSAKLLGKLHDLWPEETFTAVAAEHERRRAALATLADLLHEGKPGAAGEFLERERRYGELTDLPRPVTELPAALAALQAYAEADRAPDSDAAAERLEALLKETGPIAASPRFTAFVAAERTAIEALREEERQAAIRSLTGKLDLAVASGDLSSRQMLAQLAALDPDHLVVRLAEAVTTADWAAGKRLAAEERRIRQSSAFTELVCCMYWGSLSLEEKQALGRGLLAGEPETLSGMLLRARAAAVAGDWQTAVEALRELQGTIDLPAEVFAELLRDGIMPGEAFTAACWRSPCPGVADILTRIGQIRAARTVSPPAR